MKKLVSIATRYGLIGGLLGFVAIWALFAMGRHPYLIPVFFDFRVVLFSGIIFLALREFREYHQQGVLYLWQGMVGSYVSVVAAALVGSVLVFLLAHYSQTFVTEYIDLLMAQLTQNPTIFLDSVGEEAYNYQLQQLPNTTAWNLTVDYFLKSLIIGLFLTIVFAVILRKQPKNNL